MRPTPKHKNSKYHVFCQYDQDGTLQAQHISGNDHAANILTKPPNFDTFTKHRLTIMGW
jgi:hypothetical protein